MKSPDPLLRRRLLLESLTVLAADARVQVAWLTKYEIGTDEIALDFEHAFAMAEALVEEGRLDPGVRPDLRETNALLSTMSGADNAERWSEDALSVDEGWCRARQVASCARR
ncbi:hypothetical protein [Streptomyces sp. NPDC086787]|uniref:hypothetical protein n=1 Tax=Streptomyces sp. NPDC086787 TaxID=3365759 RepID=UPI0037F348C1